MHPFVPTSSIFVCLFECIIIYTHERCIIFSAYSVYLLLTFSSSWAGRLFQRYDWHMLRFLPAWNMPENFSFSIRYHILNGFLNKSSQSCPTCIDTIMNCSFIVHLHCQGWKGSKISALHWARCKSWWMMFVQITEETTKLVSLVSLGDGQQNLGPVVAKVGRCDGIERLGSTVMHCDVSNMEEIWSVTNFEGT